MTSNLSGPPPSTTTTSTSAGSLSSSSEFPETDQFNLSPLIRITLLLLYGVLLIPLPFLATATDAPIPPELLWVGITVGGVLLYAALTERVIVDHQQIQLAYPRWVPSFWRQGWSLQWAEITALKPRSTGQGGIVYYFLKGDDQAYLLPMRVAGFARLLRYVQAHTDLNMKDVKPLAQPWMYIILLGCTLLLGLVDAWVIGTSMTLS